MYVENHISQICVFRKPNRQTCVFRKPNRQTCIQNVELGKPSEQLGHVLVQLTATLRNMADVSGLRLQYLHLQVLQELCKVMVTYPTDADLILNISRLFRYCDHIAYLHPGRY